MDVVLSMFLRSYGRNHDSMEHLLYPRLGFDMIIPVFCAAILGGIGNPYGAMLGALTLALAENIILSLDFGYLASLDGLFNIGSIQISTGYKPAISFVILIAVLLFQLPRPGLF